MEIVSGTPVHFEGTSSDASSGLNLIPFFPGTTSTLTLSGRVLQITDLSIVGKAGGTVTLQSRTATGTVTLFAGVIAANGGLSRPFNLPPTGLRGGSLVLAADAGVIHIQIEGMLVY